MANNKAFKVKNDLELAIYDKFLSNPDYTAIDVFVYDTRKDSDGGAWRYRTQHTSWYQEDLNTSTRGSRREFPAVAVIVFGEGSEEAAIYDGDHPDLPMWYKGTGTNILGFACRGTTSVTAYNGMIMATHSHTVSPDYDGLRVCDFVRDKGFWTWNTTNKPAYVSYGLASTNDGGGGVFNNNNRPWPFLLNEGAAIIDEDMYDVAITVLPGAPIDPATLLPKPTVAIATNLGTTIIHNTGTVSDITYSNFNIHTGVAWLGQDLFIANDNAGTNSRFQKVHKIFTQDVSAGTGYQGQQSDTEVLSFTGDRVLYDHDFSYSYENTNWQSDRRRMDNNAHAFGHTGGLVQFHGTRDHGVMFNNTTSTWSSGFQTKDSVGTLLASTSTDNVTGSELVTNGDFASGTADWTVGGTGASGAVASGQYTLTRDGTSATLTQTISGMTDGADYVISFDLIGTTGSASVRVDFEGSSSDTTNTNGVVSFTATASGTIGTLQFNVMNTTSGTITFDNVSLRLADSDRSYRYKSAGVFGTITKDVVRTDAELVAYSGFSSSNYLQVPHNTDYDFGTGDFCVINWFRIDGNDHTDFNSFYDNGYGGQEYFNVGLIHPDGTINFRTRDNGVNNNLVSERGTLDDNAWHCLVCLRRNSVKEIWIDGHLDNTQYDNDDVTTSAPFRIGLRADGARYVQGELALLRVFAGAPEAHLLQKIYEEEKYMFLPDSKVTLYGTSDSVQGLAFDDKYKLIHAGTSTSGRSVFSGLRRIDNTTQAVGNPASISASNGLVADE